MGSFSDLVPHYQTLGNLTGNLYDPDLTYELALDPREC
jgi:hypothetical protein